MHADTNTIYCFSSIIFDSLRYGEGPYRVEMQIEFPGGETPERMTEIIVIEMAPLDMVCIVSTDIPS